MNPPGSVLEHALALLTQPAGSKIEGVVSFRDPVAAVRDAVTRLGFDEVIISISSGRVNRWLHRDPARRIRALGTPVTELPAAR